MTRLTSDEIKKYENQNEPAQKTVHGSTRLTRAQAKKFDVKPLLMLENQPKKRKLQKNNDEPEPKKSKLQMYQNCRPIIAQSSKANDVSTKLCACTALLERKCNGPMAMPSSTSDFKLNEIVWAKIKGSPEWPAQIINFPTSKMALVVWFNDNRKTKVYRTQLYKFLSNYDKFSANFDKHIGLKTAAREALYDFSNLLQ